MGSSSFSLLGGSGGPMTSCERARRRVRTIPSKWNSDARAPTPTAPLDPARRPTSRGRATELGGVRVGGKGKRRGAQDEYTIFNGLRNMYPCPCFRYAEAYAHASYAELSPLHAFSLVVAGRACPTHTILQAPYTPLPRTYTPQSHETKPTPERPPLRRLPA